MGIRLFFSAIIFSTMLAEASLPSAIAQNPLRRHDNRSTSMARINASGSNYYGSELSKQPASLHYGEYVTSPTDRANHRNRSDVQEPRRHDSVVLTQYQELPKPSRDTNSGNNAGVLGSTLDSRWQDPKQIVDLVMKISLNLIFVLSFAFGILLLVKKWNKPRLTDNDSERVKSDSLSILQTLQIDSKISIRLVKWRSNRFLVSCDQNGIQSVNPLNASFDQTLQEMEQEDSSDEQLIKKLLSGLDLSRG